MDKRLIVSLPGPQARGRGAPLVVADRAERIMQVERTGPLGKAAQATAAAPAGTSLPGLEEAT